MPLAYPWGIQVGYTNLGLVTQVFGRDAAVVMSGSFADVSTPEEKALINPISRYYKKWWYRPPRDVVIIMETVFLRRLELTGIYHMCSAIIVGHTKS